MKFNQRIKIDNKNISDSSSVFIVAEAGVLLFIGGMIFMIYNLVRSIWAADGAVSFISSGGNTGD